MKDKIDHSEWLKKITYCLYIVIVLLAINSILLIVVIGNSSASRAFSSSSTGQDGTGEQTDSQEEELPYDVSAFIEMTSDQALEAIKSSEMKVIYFGRSGCGFCRQYVPVLTALQDTYGFQTIYVDTDKLTSADAEKWMALNEYVQQNFGPTPFTLVAKDGGYVAAQLGAMNEEGLAAFLESSGFQKK